MKEGRIKKKMTLYQKDQLKGLVFVTPFIIGLCAFFLYPLFFSLWLSVGRVDSLMGMKTSFAGLQNYINAFVVDVEFLPTFWESVQRTLVQFPLTVLLALIVAIMLNRDIKCRGLYRVIFFIPFLLGSGQVMEQLINQGVDKAVLNIMDGRLIPYNVLNYFGSGVTDMVATVLSTLVSVLWSSSVQILLFLSGLQSISPSLYEAAKIDGATEWEIFWKVTVPMISPILLLTLIYSLVDSFTDIGNPLLEYIQEEGFNKGKFEYGAAMGWIYFAFIGVLVMIIFSVMRGYIHTNEVGGKKAWQRA